MEASNSRRRAPAPRRPAHCVCGVRQPRCARGWLRARVDPDHLPTGGRQIPKGRNRKGAAPAVWRNGTRGETVIRGGCVRGMMASTRTHARTHTLTRTRAHAHTYTHAHAHTACTRTHAYTHANTYTHAHTHTPILRVLPPCSVARGRDRVNTHAPALGSCCRCLPPRSGSHEGVCPGSSDIVWQSCRKTN